MALSSWVGPVRRVACHFDAWNLTVTRLVANGWPVLLDDDPTLAAHTIVVTGADDRHLTMLVVPPHTPGTAARAMLRIAATRTTIQTADEILRSHGIPA